MKDAFHGSAHPAHGLVTARRDCTPVLVRPYRGSTKRAPRRGTAHTAPLWIQRAARACLSRVPAITLDIGNPWPAIPCWSGRARRWVQHTVPTAYRQRYDTHVRPEMPNNPVSLPAVVAVAEARASFAEHRTGRHCRPSNARLAEITGLSVRTVQRASTALRLLGVATEVMRGRQRTRAERFASWRAGDRARGWASEWALHDSRVIPLSPHPEGSRLGSLPSSSSALTTRTQRKSAGSHTASRHNSLYDRPLALANRWVASPQSPPWARRYRTGTPWVPVLSGPARHGWTPRDVNQLISDWIGTGHWVPDNPHKPIGLLGAMLARHANLEERPAALEEAREAAEWAASRARLAAQRREYEDNRRAREAGKAALHGTGRAAARQALGEIAERAQRRRGNAAGGDSQ